MDKSNRIKISGTVIHGNKDGRKLGFPTANIDCDLSGIEHGVYACRLQIADETYLGVAHCGPRLVFKETKVLLEIHIFEFDKEIYGQTINATLYLPMIRKSRNFNSLDELVLQIKSDCIDAQALLTLSAE